ncbi:hypothetical protein [Streptomyces alkaliphilus]|uniref:hypothetical protein n=1 Tax=Streptomyces alkaliphilus TaxID=1472722 RepID=UPI001E63F698|nr:hypothetical protein [Streptomyces alkaliphilus]
MSSVTDLHGVVDVDIGVDAHVNTHSAAVVDSHAGGVLGELTVEATAEGYARLARRLGHHEEVVVELDRPQWSKRRNGAKSDPLDVIRAAREALARARPGTLAAVATDRHSRCCRPHAGPR